MASGIYFLIKSKWSDHEILGIGIVFGAAAGVITSLLIWFENDVVAESIGGFWKGVLLFFPCVVLFGATCSIFGIAVKNLILSLIRFDFAITLLSFIVGVSCFYGGISIILGCIQYNPVLGICVLIGVFGSASGIAGPTVSSNEFIDSNGNRHWVTSRNADGSLTTTDGERMRQMPDKTYKNY